MLKTKKRILVLIDWFTPGYKAGGPIQSCINLIDHLRDDFDFYVVTRNTDYCDPVPYASVKSDEWNCLKEGLHVYYISSSKLSGKDISKIINTEDYDMFYVNGMYSWFFSILPLWQLRKKSNKVIVASRGMLAEGALSIKPFKKILYLRLAGLLGFYKKLVFHATNEQEIIDIKKRIGGSTTVKLAPNLPKKTTLVRPVSKNKSAGNLRLVNIARISPEKNLKFALQVLSGIKDAQVDFDIYGPVYDPSYWSECQQIINTLPSSIQVSYKGALESEKVNPVLTGYHCMFMPTLGENFGHIIIESMAAACPVIISDKTMWKGLAEKKAGWDIPLQTELFISVINIIAKMDREKYNEWENGAFNCANAYYENQELMVQSKSLFVKLAFPFSGNAF